MKAVRAKRSCATAWRGGSPTLLARCPGEQGQPAARGGCDERGWRGSSPTLLAVPRASAAASWLLCDGEQHLGSLLYQLSSWRYTVVSKLAKY